MTDKPTSTEYCWSYTIQGSVDGRPTVFEYGGVMVAKTGATRERVYEHLRQMTLDKFRQHVGHALEQPVTLFRSLEPNRL